MIRKRALFVALLSFFLLATSLVAAPPTAPSGLTVGDFAVMVASRMHLDGAAAPLTPVRAVEVLNKAGVTIKSGLASPLTEGDVAELFQQFGIAMQSQHTGDSLSRERAAALIGIFGPTFNSAAAKSESFSRPSKVNTQSPGNTVAAATPELTLFDCQSLPRTPTTNPCQDCCIHQLGLSGKICGHACQKRNLVISPDEPTP